MSAITGIYHLDNRPVDQEVLNKMMAALAHRGPDGAGVWVNGQIGLGHRMLWTTPESINEKLPFESNPEDLVITADARIDNREELISIFGLKQRSESSISDSELILASYKKWGEDCPKKLLGDFAFAIWDKRKKNLFCARDPMGIKPFYYYKSEKIFVFASEVKGILANAEVPRRLNETRVADHLVPIFHDHTSTYYQDIVQLPHAHCMTRESGKSRSWRYWSLDHPKEITMGSDEEYQDAFRDLLNEAIRCRLRSAYPVGSTLSGGLDSSAIACLGDKIMKANGENLLHTFSAIFPSIAGEDPNSDDVPFIESVLKEGDFKAHFAHIDRCKPLEDTTLYKDEVVAAPNWYMFNQLFGLAQKTGVRVILSGQGGDEVVSYGYEYLEQLANSARWEEFVKETNGISQNFGGTPVHYFRQYGVPYFTELAQSNHWPSFIKQACMASRYLDVNCMQLLLKAGLLPFIPESICGIRQRLAGRRPSASRLNQAIKPEFARSVGLEGRIRGFNNNSGFSQFILGMFDQASGIFSLEQRYPFYDKRLMEFCVAIPFEQKLKHGWTRSIFRRAMENILPTSVQWRTDKGNLGRNIRYRLFEERKILDSIILEDPGLIEMYVDVLVLQKTYDRFLDKPADCSEDDLFTIYLTVSLAIWLRQSGVALNTSSNN